MGDPDEDRERESEGIEGEAKLALLEARTVLPGVQTLFGFQLAVIFTEHFQRRTSFSDQCIHVLALSLVAVIIALLLTPAAFHRQVEPGEVSTRFSEIITRCLRWALLLLSGALALSMYLVVDTVFQRWPWSLLAGVGTLGILVSLWFVFPLRERQRRDRSRKLQRAHL